MMVQLLDDMWIMLRTVFQTMTMSDLKMIFISLAMTSVQVLIYIVQLNLEDLVNRDSQHSVMVMKSHLKVEGVW